MDPENGLVDIDSFRKADLRVGRVTAAEDMGKSRKLIKLSVSFGKEEKTILSGIRPSYSAEELVGKKVVVVYNLKPASIMGMESQGMVLAASDDSAVSLLSVDKDMPEGSRVT